VGQSLVIAVVGVVTIAYVMIGGMKGTTWVQIIKAVLLITAVGVTTVWILALNGFDLSAVLGKAVDSHPDGTAILEPMLNYGGSAPPSWASSPSRSHSCSAPPGSRTC